MGTVFPAFGPRPWVLGVLNVTPDSFSDGGQWADTDSAIARGLALAADGADIVDVGGESTRPGAHRVDAVTEAGRVVPVIRALAEQGVQCSVDTTRSEVAQAAVRAGAAIVNDVSGGMADPDMAAVVADAAVPWILMHWRGPSDIMNSLAHYQHVVPDVRSELLARVDAALAAGVDERSLIIDPGLGFAKDAVHNWDVLVGLDALVELGLPVLIGASRKRFLGELLAAPDGTPRPPDGRETATAAISLLAAQAGVWGVRVHDVTPTRDALRALDLGDPSRIDGTGSGIRRAAWPLLEPSAEAGLFGVLRLPEPGLPEAPRLSSGAVDPSGPSVSSERSRPVPNADDRIVLTGLTVRGHHGVFDHEKRDGQDFVIDVTVWHDHAPAARDDDLAQTLNYAELAELARAVVAGPSRDLIETVAVEIADTAVARWPIRRIEVSVHKPHAPIPLDFADVAVTVARDAGGRRPAGGDGFTGAALNGDRSAGQGRLTRAEAPADVKTADVKTADVKTADVTAMEAKVPADEGRR